MPFTKKYLSVKRKVTIGDIIYDVADITGCTLGQAKEMIRATFTAISSRLNDREAVNIPRFGTFSVCKSKAGLKNTFVNGKLAKIYVPPKYKPSFYYHKRLREQIRNLEVE